jgi:hypothetical protein
MGHLQGDAVVPKHGVRPVDDGLGRGLANEVFQIFNDRRDSQQCIALLGG